MAEEHLVLNYGTVVSKHGMLRECQLAVSYWTGTIVTAVGGQTSTSIDPSYVTVDE